MCVVVLRIPTFDGVVSFIGTANLLPRRTLRIPLRDAYQLLLDGTSRGGYDVVEVKLAELLECVGKLARGWS